VSELLRAKGRGRNFMLYEMIFPIGLMVAGQVGTVIVPAFGWRSLFLFGGIPGILVACLLCKLPESPRWLIGRGRFDEAERTIAQAAASARKKDPGYEFDQELISLTALPVVASSAVSNQSRSRWRELLSGRFRARTLIAWALWACSFFI